MSGVALPNGITEEDALRQPAEILSILRNLTTAEVVTIWKDGTWRRELAMDAWVSQTEPDYLVSIPLSELLSNPESPA